MSGGLREPTSTIYGSHTRWELHDAASTNTLTHTCTDLCIQKEELMQAE